MLSQYNEIPCNSCKLRTANSGYPISRRLTTGTYSLSIIYMTSIPSLVFSGYVYNKKVTYLTHDVLIWNNSNAGAMREQQHSKNNSIHSALI